MRPTNAGRAKERMSEHTRDPLRLCVAILGILAFACVCFAVPTKYTYFVTGLFILALAVWLERRPRMRRDAEKRDLRRHISKLESEF